MPLKTITAYAVLRRDDETARAVFAVHQDATAFAETLNAHVPFAEAMDPTKHALWAVYPWTAAHDFFNVEG